MCVWVSLRSSLLCAIRSRKESSSIWIKPFQILTSAAYSSVFVFSDDVRIFMECSVASATKDISLILLEVRGYF